MGLNRRTFVKFLAGAGVGVTFTPIPWKLLDDVSIWSQNWPWIPSNIKGESKLVSTVSKYCPSGLSYNVRVVGDRPVRTLPNPEHPLGGGLTALAAAEVQMLYSPGRVQHPLRRSPDGKLIEASWEEAFNILVDGLKKAGSSVAAVSGDQNGTINEFISSFIAGAGSDKTFMMPSEGQSAAKAWKLMGGEGQPGYDIENSDYVLAIGANILESWGTVARNRRAFSARAGHGEAPTVRFVFAGPVQNNTAAGSDIWLPIKPGTETILALGLANLLIADFGKSFDSSDFDDFKALAAQYSPAKVQEITGVPADQLKAVAKDLAEAKTPLVLAGSSFAQGSGTGPAMAGFALNLLLGGLNAEGGLKALADNGAVVSGGKSRNELYQNDLVAYFQAGKMPKAMLFYEANPVYALPDHNIVLENLQKIGFKVSFSTFMNETAEICDLVLPIPMGLERADDVYTPYGSGQVVYSLAVPVIDKPLVDARTGDEILSKAAAALGYKLGVKNLAEAVKAKAQSLGADLKKLGKGEGFVSDETVSPSLSLKPQILSKIAKAQTAAATDKLMLAPQFKLNIGVPVTGIPPFNTKTITANELLGKDMFVTMNGATAAANGLTQGDLVEISNDSGSIKARVHVFEGIVPGAVGVLLGFGHSAMDEFSQNKGANAMKVISASAEPGTGISTWAQTGVNIAKVRG